jgi:hypothetical protein
LFFSKMACAGLFCPVLAERGGGLILPMAAAGVFLF